MKDPLYSDPAKQAKLEEAIRLGFIERTEKDGLQVYTLTQRGLQQYMTEKMLGQFG